MCRVFLRACVWCLLSCFIQGAASTACPANSSQENIHNITCVCNPGYSGVPESGCRQCLPNTFKPLYGPGACTPCSNGRVSVAGSLHMTDCGCRAGFVFDSVMCMPCPHGTYKNESGNRPCEECVAGKYGANTGAASEDMCTQCPLNMTSRAASRAVESCTCTTGFGLACGQSRMDTVVINQVTPVNTGDWNYVGVFDNIRHVEISLHRTGSKQVIADAFMAVCEKMDQDVVIDDSSDTKVTMTGNWILQTASGAHESVNRSYHYSEATDSLRSVRYDFSNDVACRRQKCSLYTKYRSATNRDTHIDIHVASSITTCSLCVAGKYKSDRGLLECEDCPRHSHSPPGSTLSSNCTCNAGYSGVDGGICTTCAAAKYRAGNFRTNWVHTCGSDRRSACALTQCTASSNALAAGWIDETNNTNTCTATQREHNPWWSVDLGKPRMITGVRLRGRSDCCMPLTKNVRIYVGNHNTAAERFVSNSLCVFDQSQFDSDGGARDIQCGVAILGQYVYITLDFEEADVFSIYEIEAWASECTECPPFSQSVRGGTQASDCRCNAGYTATPEGLCTACEIGKAKKDVGPAPCTPCPLASYAATMSSTDCQECSSGKYSLVTSLGSISDAICQDCHAGTWSGVQRSTTRSNCILCEDGKYNSLTGSTSSDACLKCAPGKYHNDTGASNEEACEACECTEPL